MRPLVAVIGLLLTGALLACSDPVPPPGAKLSGTVWIDANANGLRDSCDSPEPPISTVLELRGNSGERLQATVRGDGTFTFTHVPEGAHTLVVQQRDNFQWLVTAPQDGASGGGYDLQLRGYEELDGLDFGVATKWPFALRPESYGLLVVLYDDMDLDNEIDAGECPVNPHGLRALVDGMDLSPAAGDLAVYTVRHLAQVPDNVTVSYLSFMGSSSRVPATLDLTGCPEPVTPVAIPGSRLFQAEISMRPAGATATVRAGTWADLDADGVHDEGEPLLDSFLVMVAACSGSGEIWPNFSDDRTDVFTNVPAGVWRFRTRDPSSEGLVTAPVELHVKAPGTTEIEIGLSSPGKGYIEVTVTSDGNHNGSSNADEPPAANADVCLSSPDQLEWPACRRALAGTAVLGPLKPGSYGVHAILNTAPPTPPYDFNVTVAADEVVSVTISLPP